jgi:two-component system response regulator
MPKSILIVEDVREDAEMLQRTIRKASLTNPIRIVESCRDAIDYIKGAQGFSDRKKHPEPGIIFIDMRIPGMDGVELLEWLKQNTEDDKILSIAISGNDDFATAKRAYKAGASSFVSKPFKTDDLEILMDGFPGPWKKD